MSSAKSSASLPEKAAANRLFLNVFPLTSLAPGDPRNKEYQARTRHQPDEGSGVSGEARPHVGTKKRSSAYDDQLEDIQL